MLSCRHLDLRVKAKIAESASPRTRWHPKLDNQKTLFAYFHCISTLVTAIAVAQRERYRCCATGQGLETGLNADAHMGRQRSVKATGRDGAHPDPLTGQITSRDQRHADDAALEDAI
jgi:hypothetical protein